MKVFAGRKGFTLIEMLVVVAIIGILSATVLAALGPSRNKAKDARIISGISQALVLAETLYDSSDVNHYTRVTLTQPDIMKVATDVTAQGGSLQINVASSSVAFYSTLASGGTYCADSLGQTGDSANNGACQ